MLYKYNNIVLDLSERTPKKIDFTCNPEFVARVLKAYEDYVEKKDNPDIKEILFLMVRISSDGCDTKFVKE